ncbi:MAG: M23 family metallopeptidase [Inquilinus sp.]|nr:M23 family metallopeptidase [Inquilinus sp.]
MTPKRVPSRVPALALAAGTALSFFLHATVPATARGDSTAGLPAGAEVENLFADPVDGFAVVPSDSLDAGPDAAAPAAARERREVTLGRGDTLVETVIDAGVSPVEANQATRSLRGVLNPRRLQAGQRIALVLEEAADGYRLVALEIARRQGGFALVVPDGETGFVAQLTEGSALDEIAAAPAAMPEPATVPDPVAAADPVAAPGPVAAAPAEPGLQSDRGELKVERLDLTLGRGDTLVGTLAEAGVARPAAHQAIAALRGIVDPRRLQAGQAIAVAFERQGNERRFLGFQLIQRDGSLAIAVREGEDGFRGLSVGDPAGGAHAWVGPRPAPAGGRTPVLEAVFPSLARVPHGSVEIDALVPAADAVFVAGTDDSRLEEIYLRFLDLRIERLTLTVGRGDTLAGMMDEAGVGRADAHAAIAALRGVFNPRRMRAGQEVGLVFEVRGDDRRFTGIELAPDIETRVAVVRTETGEFDASAEQTRFQTRLLSAAGTIESSLYQASNDAGVPDPILIAVIRAYSFEVDFQRDIRPGDGFELLYEQDYADDGAFARHGNVLFANLRLRGRNSPMYRYQSSDGSIDYYDRDGQSVRRTLMRTPIDGARISSRFGMRRHPILGYSRMHRGTDFAAPRGTPIYAAGSGTIEVRGRNGGYGNYIRIRHNGSLKTAYAHLSRFARGVSRGSRVQQGQVIGYVGTTGRSTGPHLHYEVLMGDRQVNALTLDLPSGRKLDGAELAAFQRVVLERDQQYAEALNSVQVAQTPR